MKQSFEQVREWAESGDAEAQYQYAFALANLPQAERQPMLVAKWLRLAAQNGSASARQLIWSCGIDPDDGRLYAEVRILLLQELWRQQQEEWAKELDEADQFMIAPSAESDKDSQYGDAWLLKNQPEGTKVPGAQSRGTVRTPDLNCANPLRYGDGVADAAEGVVAAVAAAGGDNEVCFESHFMSDFLAGKVKSIGGDLFTDEARASFTISQEALAVLDAGRELWRYYHAQPKANPNASYYDIRKHFQGVKVDAKGKEKMNATSGDLR